MIVWSCCNAVQQLRRKEAVKAAAAAAKFRPFLPLSLSRLPHSSSLSSQTTLLCHMFPGKVLGSELRARKYECVSRNVARSAAAAFASALLPVFAPPIRLTHTLLFPCTHQTPTVLITSHRFATSLPRGGTLCAVKSLARGWCVFRSFCLGSSCTDCPSLPPSHSSHTHFNHQTTHRWVAVLVQSPTAGSTCGGTTCTGSAGRSLAWALLSPRTCTGSRTGGPSWWWWSARFWFWHQVLRPAVGALLQAAAVARFWVERW